MDLSDLTHLLRHLLRQRRQVVVLLLLGIILPWSAFLKAASEIREREGFPGDQAFLRWLHAHATPPLDALNLLLTRVGGPQVMAVVTLLIAGFLFWRRSYHQAWFFSWAVGGAMVINLLAKALLGRVRPALWVSLAPETTPSFPSGHAMGSAAVVLALGLILAHSPRRWLLWLPGALFVLGVGISRMYLGVHYPSDVLAGWIASVGWVTSVYLLFNRSTLLR